MMDEKRRSVCGVLAEAIREASRAGRPICAYELLQKCQWTEGAAPVADELEALLADTLSCNPDLAVFKGISGNTLYHAPAILSRTYASIQDRKSSPVMLIAEEVRFNSAEYPRPLPLALFLEPPFELTPEQIKASLKAMASDACFQDIAYTTTSTGAVFLFSTRYLERSYAEFLAERADVGPMVGP